MTKDFFAKLKQLYPDVKFESLLFNEGYNYSKEGVVYSLIIFYHDITEETNRTFRGKDFDEAMENCSLFFKNRMIDK